MMTVQEFSTKIKSKYPQYKDMDDLELTNKVINKYPQYKSQVQIGETPTPKKPGFLTKAGRAVLDVGIGVAKGTGSTLANASELGYKTLLKPIDKLMGTEGQTAVQKYNINEKLQATNTAQKVGFMGEQIAEFFLPGGASIRAGKVAEAALQGNKLAKLGKLVATSATEGSLALGQTTLQKGGVDEEAKTAGIAGAVLPPAFKTAGGVVKGVGKIGGKVLGLTTGAGSQVIEEVFKNPNVIKFARQASGDIDKFQDDILQQAKNGLNKIRELRSSKYKNQLEKIKLNPKELDNITNEVRDKAVQLLDEADINPIFDNSGKKLNNFDFNKSTIVEGANVVEKAFNDVLSWTDNTAVGLDKLKKRLFTYSDQLSSRDKNKAKYIVDQLANSIDSGLKKNVKGYQEMTKDYAKVSNLIDDINKTLSLGNKKAKETSIKKIFGSLKENNEQRKEMLNILSKSSGEDLVGKVAGAQLSEYAPKGLVGKLLGGGSTLGIVASPSYWPQLFIIALMSSPKMVGEIIGIAGKTTEEMIKLNKYSPQIQRAIRQLLIKMNQN